MIEDRNIRIFLSSTFADMQEERNYLVKKTLPALYAECKKRNVDISVVDLRWGITEEESKTGKVIEICLDEIERTRPFFIGIVGGRYGWIPNESEFKINEHLLLKYPWIKEKIDNGVSITELEMQYGALENSDKVKSFFFLREINSVPKKYREKEGSKEFYHLNKLRKQIESSATEGKCQMTSYKSISSLGDAVYRQLMAFVDELYPEKEENQWERIESKQCATIARLKKKYCRRNDIVYENSNIEFIKGINTDSDRCILLYGESGYGKTSFLTCEIGEEINGIPVYHAIIDDELDTVDKLSRFLLYQLSSKINDFVCPEINDKEKKIDIRHALVWNKQTDSQLFWILDGIERLSSSEDKSMNWLTSVPENISLIISTADKGIINKVKSVWKNGDIKQCIIPALSASCIMEITSTYLRNLSKVLTTQQRSHICAHPVLSNPRMLQLFLSEISTFGVYEKLNEYIDQFIKSEDISDFLIVFLTRIERDFGKEVIRDLLLLLCMSNIGLTEQQLNEYLKLTPIDLCAIINAVEPITKYQNKYLLIENELIRRIITEHFDIDLSEVGKLEIKIRLFIIKCLNKEIRKIIVKEGTPWYVKILPKVFIIQWLCRSDSEQYLHYNTELANQYIRIGGIDKLYRMSKNKFGVLNPKTFLILRNYKDGIPGLFSIWFLLYIHYILNCLDPVLFIINNLTTTTQKEIFIKKINRLLFFKKFKQHIKDTLCPIQQEDCYENFEDTWNVDRCEDIDYVQVVTFSQQILCSGDFNLSRIKKILHKSEQLLMNEELKLQNEDLYVSFCYICCSCYLRLDNFKEAMRYFSLQQGVDGCGVGAGAFLTNFLLAIKGKDFPKCHQILKEFESVDDSYSLYNKARLSIIIMDAEGEKEEAILDYIHRIVEKTKDDEEQSSTFMSIGTWLYIWGLKKYAKESFNIALNLSKCIDEKIICYVNLANCCDDSTECINFLKKRVEFATRKYGEKWDDALLEYYLDFLVKLRKTSPQTVCDEIDDIIATYNDLSDKAKTSLYHLKAGCYGDMYDKTNDEEIYSKGLLLLNNALEYTSAQTDDYYAIIISRVAYLLRKKESPIHFGLLKKDQIIIENGVNLSSEDIRDEIRNCLLGLYIDTKQMTEACKFYESCPNPEIFSTWKRQKINEFNSENSELVSIAEEKIQRIRTKMEKGEIVEGMKWIVDEKMNGYDFELVKHILHNRIIERIDVAKNKCVLNIFDFMTNKKLEIPDTFYREYLFEPNMAIVIIQETNASWSLENINNMKSFPNGSDVISLLEDNRKTILERGCQRLFSLCHDFNLSEDDYIKVFINYSTILGEHLHKLLDLIQNREDAADILVQFLDSSPFKSYDICKQLYSEIERIKPLVEENSDLEKIISDVIDDCAYNMFEDGDKADYSIDILLGIVDVLDLKQIGNYTLYMIIQTKYNGGDWFGIISTYSDYCIQANDTVSFFINIYAAQSYANIGDKENAVKLIKKLLDTEGECNYFATQIYGKILLQFSEYQECNNYVVSFLNDHHDDMSIDNLVEFWKILSVVKLYIGEYEHALKFLDMFQQICEKDEELVYNIRNGRIYRLIIFYVRQGLDNDALSIYQKTTGFEEMGFSDLKIRAYIELSRMYIRLNKFENAMEMKEKAMACMSEHPYYMKEYEDFIHD